jgi:hypothetical protein
MDRIQQAQSAQMSKSTDGIDVVEIPQDPIVYTEEQIDLGIKNATSIISSADRMMTDGRDQLSYWQELKDKFIK